MSWPMMPPAGSGNCTVASAQVSLAVMWSLSLPLVSPGENCFSVSLITSQLLTTLGTHSKKINYGFSEHGPISFYPPSSYGFSEQNYSENL